MYASEENEIHVKDVVEQEGNHAADVVEGVHSRLLDRLKCVGIVVDFLSASGYLDKVRQYLYRSSVVEYSETTKCQNKNNLHTSLFNCWNCSLPFQLPGCLHSWKKLLDGIYLKFIKTVKEVLQKLCEPS